MRLTPWVDDPTWGVLRSRVCAWLWARQHGMRVALGYGAGAIWKRQAEWLGLDWDIEQPGKSALGAESLSLSQELLETGRATKVPFWTGEVAWYGIELVKSQPISWHDLASCAVTVDPGEGWHLYAALLPDLGGGGPSDVFAQFLADRATGVTHICLDATEMTRSARYLAISRCLAWGAPALAHLPRLESDRPVRLAAQMARGLSGADVAMRAALESGCVQETQCAEALFDLVHRFSLASGSSSSL